MKYIRTKQGIFKITGEDFIHYFYNDSFLNGVLTKALIRDSREKDDEHIKVSDKLEELCDEFVYENPKYDIPHRCFYQTYRKEWCDWDLGWRLTDKEFSTIKGGIWTDKGFIYTSKINNKGELELI